MPRLNLKSKEIRSRLKPSGAPYWMEIDRGLHLGYRRNKRGGVWCVRARAHGRYVKRTIGDADDLNPADGEFTLSFSQARRAAEEYHANAQLVAAPANRNGGYTVADAITDYMDWYKLNRKAFERTQHICNRHIIPSLGDRPVNALRTPEIDRWLRKIAQSPPLSPSGEAKPPYAIKTFTGEYTKPKGRPIYEYTPLPYKEWTEEMQRKRKSSANRILTVLKAALNHAWRNSYINNQEAWARVKPFENADAPRVQHLSEQQARNLLDAASEDFKPLAKAALFTGCRYGELRNLHVSDFRDGMIHIAVSKTGKARDIPLSAEGAKFFKSLTKGKEADDLMLTHKDGSEWGRSHQSRPMLQACKKAGIEPAVSFHILRHSYATLLLESNGSRGMSIRDVAALLGDTVATCEKHYGHVIQDALKREVARKMPSFEAV